MSKYRKTFVKGNNMNEIQALQEEQVQEEVVAQEELAAFAQEEQVTQEPVVEEPLPTPVVKAQPAPAPVVEKLIVKQEDNSFEAKINRLRQSGTAAQKSVIAKMDSYFAQMKPGLPVDPVKGGAHQLAFYMALRQVCETETTEFREAFKLILEYFRQYKDGALGDRYIFRFTENIQLTNTAMRPFLGLINLLRVAAEAKSREQVLKQVDLTRSLETGFSDQARQRIIQFFHV